MSNGNGVDPFGGWEGVFTTQPAAPEYPYAYDAADIPTVYNPPASPVYDFPTTLVAEPPPPGESGGFNVQDFFKGVTPILSAGAGAAVKTFVSGFFGAKPEARTAVRQPTAPRPTPMLLQQTKGLGSWLMPLLIFLGIVILGMAFFRRS